jgi:hypothetical protein
VPSGVEAAGFFDAADVETVFGELPEDLRPVMRFAYCAGWRVQSEVLPLTWRDVDLCGRASVEASGSRGDVAAAGPRPAVGASLNAR